MGSFSSRPSMVEGYPDPLSGIPLLFPVVRGKQRTENIYMNVTNWKGDCPACQAPAYDYRGTSFKCCGRVVCTKCTDAVCSDAAEKMRLSLRNDLCHSGRVLQDVLCPMCHAAGNEVGFPMNSGFGKVFAAKNV